MQKKSKLFLIILTVVVGVTVCFYAGRRFHGESFRTVDLDDPLKIKLIGVRPDGGDAVFDPSGNLVEGVPLPPMYREYWDQGEMMRDFIFQIPQTEEEVFFYHSAYIVNPHSATSMVAAANKYYQADDETALYAFFYGLHQTSRYNFFGMQFENPVTMVDIELPYYWGPEKPSQWRFTGPFKPGQIIASDQDSQTTITIKPLKAGSFNEIDSEFKFLSQTYSHVQESEILVYDKQGRRHRVESAGGQSGANKTEMNYRIRDLSWEDIAAITFGEEPYAVRFENVNVDFPQLPDKNYLPYLDAVAERLNLKGKSAKEIVEYQYQQMGVNESLKIIDIAEGNCPSLIVTALYNHYNTFDIESVDEDIRTKMKDAAAKWSASLAQSTHYAGICLGLINHQPEYIDATIDILAGQQYSNVAAYWGNLPRYGEIARILSNMGPSWSPEQTQKIKEIIYNSDQQSVYYSLLSGLYQQRQSYTTAALKELALCDKPWIWWEAVDFHQLAEPDFYQDISAMDQTMRDRIALRKYDRNSEDFVKQAAEYGASVWDFELYEKNHNAFSGIRADMVRHMSREFCTQKYIEFLQSVKDHYGQIDFMKQNNSPDMLVQQVIQIVFCLNLWYDQDFGGLGKEPLTYEKCCEIAPKNYLELDALVNEILQWRTEHPNAMANSPVFVGQIVDSQQNPIANATIEMQERYIVGKGSVKRGSVHQLKTDAEGGIHFQIDHPDYEYEMTISAEGYRSRSQINITKSDINGGYLSRDGNLFELSKASGISGCLLSPEGNPVADASVQIRPLDRRYSLDIPGAVKTDQQGHFSFHDFPRGWYIISWVQTGQNLQTEDTNYKLYGGVCAAVAVELKEDQELNNIILDTAQSTGQIDVVLTDPKGQPVTQAAFDLYLHLYPDGKHQSEYITTLYLTSGDGQYHIQNLPLIKGTLTCRDIKSSQFSDTVQLDLKADEPAGFKMCTIH